MLMIYNFVIENKLDVNEDVYIFYLWDRNGKLYKNGFKWDNYVYFDDNFILYIYDLF